MYRYKCPGCGNLTVKRHRICGVCGSRKIQIAIKVKE